MCIKPPSLPAAAGRLRRTAGRMRPLVTSIGPRHITQQRGKSPRGPTALHGHTTPGWTLHNPKPRQWWEY